MMIDDRHSHFGDDSGNGDDSRRKSPLPGHSVQQEIPRPLSPMVDPSLSSSSTALPATPTNASPVGDLSTTLSAIQTVLTAVLPGLIQGEVRIQCTKLAQDIGAQISSIQEEVNRPPGDQDDL